MDPIDGVRAGGPVAPVRRRPAAGGGFSVAEGGEARASGEAEAVAEASLAGLLALQEESGGEVRDRAARRRGLDLLAELAALQREVLAGDPGADRLARLAGMAAEVPDAADPRLRDAVAAIALRARVEAARYGGG
jgi:hypothetical protein